MSSNEPHDQAYQTSSPPSISDGRNSPAIETSPDTAVTTPDHSSEDEAHTPPVLALLSNSLKMINDTNMEEPEQLSTPPAIPDRDPNKPSEEEPTYGPIKATRFDIELEFIQSLSSPTYLHHLSTSSYFTDPAFIAYLKYLQYWKQPEYAKFIHYPGCLRKLDLLQKEEFRAVCGNFEVLVRLGEEEVERVGRGKGASVNGGQVVVQGEREEGTPGPGAMAMQT